MTVFRNKSSGETAFYMAASMDSNKPHTYNGTDSVSTVILIQDDFENHSTKMRVAVSIYHFPFPKNTMSKLKDDLTPFIF